MNTEIIINVAKKVLGRAGLYLKKYAPEILIGAGVTGDFTDNKYGWKDIRNAKVVVNALYGGYYIRMPRMIVLD